MSEVGSRLQGRVAVVTFDNPPVNGLSHAVRVGLARALERAIADEAVAAVVLAGGSRHFSAGADIREFGTPAATAEPTLRQLIELVEDAPKPVIAAIQGSCLGGGLELALAAHYRIAARDATLGLPEVKLGLIPGAGGTQRLPRLVAPARALELILGGEPVRATALGESGLLDRVVSGDPVEEAIAFAESESPPPRRTRDRAADPAALAAACEAARVRLSSERHPLPATLRAVEAVAAAALPFDKGLTVERLAFVELMQSPESKALRHAFLAERAAGKVADLAADTPVRPLEQAAVIGAGTMGAGIAVSLLDAGLPVWLLETDEAALTRGRGRIAGIYEAQVQKGRLTPAERDRRLGLLRPTLEYGALAGCRRGDRGGVRVAAGQARGVHRARPGHEARGDPRHQHLDARRERDRGVHPPSRRRPRPALLQSGERDASAGGGARARDCAGSPGDGARARPDAAQGRGGLGGVRRVHRQPDARRLCPPGVVAGRGRRDAVAG